MGLRRFGGPGMHGIGGVPLASMGGGALGTYADKVLGYGPIAYWPLWETSGTVAQCLVNPAQNGTYSADVSGWPPGTGIGDGRTAPYFSGNDYVDCFTATIQAAFPGSEGTIMIWTYPAAASFNDGVTRRNITVWDLTDFNESILLQKTGGNYDHQFTYRAAGVSVIQTTACTGAFQHMAMTWSAAANQVRYLRNGSQYNTDLMPGVWAGTIDLFIIGAADNVPNNPTIGYLAHCALFNFALPNPAIANLASV